MAVIRLLPGVVVLCLGALLATTIGQTTGVNELFVAIGLGFLFANSVGIPDRLAPGFATHGHWLVIGIVLMGASVTLGTLLDVGGTVLLIILTVVCLTLLTVELLARRVFVLVDRLGSLLAAGSAICGVSAVVAVAGSIRAREDHIAYAAATVLMFDAITLIVFPIVGDLLELSSMVFGIWAGISMFSTGPVVAVGFAHSEVAGQWATVTKLARNALIGLVVLGYASYYARTGDGTNPSIRTLVDSVPPFVLGFLVFVGLATGGVFSASQQVVIEQTYNWLFAVAFVGLGTEIRLRSLRQTGLTPALVVLLALLVASSVSLALLLTLL